jgi:hypothetical protein
VGPARMGHPWPRASRGIHAARPTPRDLRSACTQVAFCGACEFCARRSKASRASLPPTLESVEALENHSCLNCSDGSHAPRGNPLRDASRHRTRSVHVRRSKHTTSPVAVRLAGVLARSGSKIRRPGRVRHIAYTAFAAAARQNAGKPDCYGGGVSRSLLIWLLIFMRDSPDDTKRDLGAG